MPFDTVILNDGNKFPTLAFGTGTKWKGHEVSQYVEQAINLGFAHIDTATFYANEKSVGDGLRQSGLARSDFYVTTKWAQGPVESGINTSLDKLGLKFVDMYLIHTPTYVTNLESTWRGFEQAKKDGKARSIGVSNFNVDLLQKLVKLAHIKPAVNQILFHPYNYAENKALLEYSANQGIVTEAYSSLSPITRYPGGPVDIPVQLAAKRLNVTATQVIFLWVKAKGVSIVTTSSSPEHLKEYLAVAELPPLTEEEILAIDEAGAKGPPSSYRRLTTYAVILATAIATFVFMRRSRI